MASDVQTTEAGAPAAVLRRNQGLQECSEEGRGAYLTIKKKIFVYVIKIILLTT